MRLGRLILFSIAGWAIASSASNAIAGQAAAALIGHVVGPDGTPLEGVVVTAARPSSTITVSVVSGADGSYRFPTNKLAPGQYFLSIVPPASISTVTAL